MSPSSKAGSDPARRAKQVPTITRASMGDLRKGMAARGMPGGPPACRDIRDDTRPGPPKNNAPPGTPRAVHLHRGMDRRLLRQLRRRLVEVRHHQLEVVEQLLALLAGLV